MIKTGFKLSLMAILLSTMCMAKKTTNNDSKSLLWRVSGNGLSKPSYLFGTMDLICPNDYIWTKNGRMLCKM